MRRRFPLAVVLALLGLAVGPAVSNAEEAAGGELPEHAVMRMGDPAWRNSGGINYVAYSPDGEVVVLGGLAYAALLDAETGRWLSDLSVGGCVAFSPDGETIANGFRSVCLWDAKTRKMLWRKPLQLRGRYLMLSAVAFTPDGEVVATLDETSAVHLWDVATARKLRTLQTASASNRPALTLGAHGLAISPNGKLLAASVGRDIVVWKLDDGTEMVRIDRPHGRDITSLAFTPDGELLVSGGTRNFDPRDQREGPEPLARVCVWSLPSGELEAELLRRRGQWLYAVRYSQDGESLMAVTNREIRLFNGSSHKPRKTIARQTRSIAIGDAAIAPAGNRIVVADGSSLAHVWNVREGEEEFSDREAHSRQVHTVAYAPRGEMMATGANDSVVHLWNTRTGEHVQKLVFTEEVGDLEKITFSPDGSVIAAAGDAPIRGHTGMVKLWSVESGALLHEIRLPGMGERLAFSPGGELLAVTCLSPFFDPEGKSKGVFLFDVETGRLRKKLEGLEEGADAVLFSPDGKALCAASPDQTMRFWNVASGRRLGQREVGGGPVDFSPDGRLLAAVTPTDEGEPGKLGIWEVKSGERIQTLPDEYRHLGPDCIAFSPHGRLLAMGFESDTLTLWDVTSGDSRLKLHVPGGEFMSMVFSPDGERLLTGMGNGTLFVWDVSPATR